MLRPRVGFHVDEAHRIATVRYIGAINGDRVVPDVLRAFRALERAWEYDCVFDLTRHDGFVEIGDGDVLDCGWQDICNGRDIGRHTAVVSVDPLIGARLPLLQGLFPFRTVKMFGSADAARAWICDQRKQSSNASAA